MSDNNNGSCTQRHLTRLRSKRAKIVSVSAQKERNLSIKKISRILRKDESKRTKEEAELLSNYSEIVKEAAIRLEKRERLKERLKEVEDVESVIDEKCKQLAEALAKAEYLVVYTGAGISTSARIPDYRGASGIWTLLQQGKDIGSHDLTQAEPTYTHMALSQLYLHGKLKHVVSQNCDGLHLRSGLPKRALSEVHGNMYIEVCRSCRPIVEYLRLFDVTEYTARYSHKTMRKCYKCNNPLVDSIVHFGERGNLPWPLNWKGACRAAEKADMILCMGSSLKVLKRYPWLWSMDKPAVRRPHLYIVNLQWTPKDYQAIIKINGKCDNVMKKVMKYLSINVPSYSKKFDPIFTHATPLCKEEVHTTDRPLLSFKQSDLDDNRWGNSELGENESDDESLDVLRRRMKSESEILNNDVKIKTEIEIEGYTEEVVTDTGQTESEVKCMKEELILITIKSSEELEDCCDLFRSKQTHEKNCINFLDENLDIPVIMHDDLTSSEKDFVNIGSVTKIIGKGNSDFLQKSDSSHATQNNSFCEKLTSCSNNSVAAQDSTSKSEKLEIKNDIKQELEETNETCKRVKKEIDAELPVKKIKCEGKEKPCDDVKVTNKSARRQISDKNSNCSFCSQQYLSGSCLFYVKMDPVFKQGEPHCECCGGSEEDDEDDGDDDVKSEGEKNGKGNEEEGDSVEKAKELQKVVNPGWYGKGFRKRCGRRK